MSVVTEHDAKQRMQDLVWRVKEEIGWEFSPQYQGIGDPIAKYLDIKIKEQKIFYGKGGMYVPGESPVIIIDPHSGEQERLNFTFFHELCHHLIRQDGDLYGFIDDHSPEDPHTILEYYCNIGAAEFLIPEADIRAIINKQGFSIELIRDLDTEFPASKPAIVIQIAQCAPHQCIVMICEYGVVPRRNVGQAMIDGIPVDVSKHLFVQYSSSSPSCKYRSGRFVVIPQDHILSGIYENRVALRGHDVIPFRSGTLWPVDCEGFFYKGKVYAVFHVSVPPSHFQLTLNI